MVKIAKKTELKARALYDSYKDKLWSLIVRFIEEETSKIGRWISNITHLREKIRKGIIALALLFSGITLILIGLADYLTQILYINSYITTIFVGFIAIVGAIVYFKS